MLIPIVLQHHVGFYIEDESRAGTQLHKGTKILNQARVEDQTQEDDSY